MKVVLEEDTIRLVSESTQDTVYLKSFVNKPIDITYTGEVQTLGFSMNVRKAQFTQDEE